MTRYFFNFKLHLLTLVILCCLTGKTGAEKLVLPKPLTAKILQLSNREDSSLEDFAVDLDVPSAGVIYRIIAKNNNIAIVSFDRRNGLPVSLMRQGLMVVVDRDTPGSLAIRKIGSPIITLGVDDQGDIKFAIEFSEEKAGLVDINIHDLLEHTLNAANAISTSKGEKYSLTTIVRKKSTIRIVWKQDADFQLCALTVNPIEGHGIAINSIRSLVADPGDWCDLQLEDFADVGPIRRLATGDIKQYFTSGPKLTTNEDYFTASKKFLAVLEAKDGIRSKISLDQGLATLAALQSSKDDASGRKAEALCYALDGLVRRDLTRQIPVDFRADIQYPYNKVDILSFLISEYGLSSTINHAASVWVAINEPGQPFLERHEVSAKLLGDLGIAPEKETLASLRERIANHKRSDFSIRFASALARLQLASDSELRLLCKAIEDESAQPLVRLDALRGLLSNNIECDNYLSALGIFNSLAIYDHAHTPDALTALTLLALRDDTFQKILLQLSDLKDPLLLDVYARAITKVLPHKDLHTRQAAVATSVGFLQQTNTPRSAYSVVLAGIYDFLPNEVFCRIMDDAIATDNRFKTEAVLALLATKQTGAEHVNRINKSYKFLSPQAKAHSFIMVMSVSVPATFNRDDLQNLIFSGLRDTDESVRWYAIKALGMLNAKGAIPEQALYADLLYKILHSSASDRETQAVVIAVHLISDGVVALKGVPRDSGGNFLINEESEKWWSINLKPLIVESTSWLESERVVADNP